jgi:hypothetical protein
LLLGVLNGGRDGVDGGDWQSAPRAAKDLAEQVTAIAVRDQINSEAERSRFQSFNSFKVSELPRTVGTLKL